MTTFVNLLLTTYSHRGFTEKGKSMAIDAGNFTDKDKLIANFYTLRSGLSIIAEESEKIRKAETEISTVTKNLSDELKKREREILQCKCDIESSQIGIENEEKRIEEAKNEKAGCGTFALGFLATALVIIINSSDSLFDEDLWLSPFLWGASIIVGLLLTWIVTQFKRNKFVKPHSNRILEYKQRIQNSLVEKARLEEEVLELKKRNESSNKTVQKLIFLENRFNEEVIPKSTALSKSVKAAMLEMSAGILNECDWQNIDLLIFYLENGRADSLKEALQLVDKQRQTDQITYAIRDAGKHIATVLDQSMTRLGRIMQQGFASLSAQIQHNHAETIETMRTSVSKLENTIRDGNREMSDKLQRINKTIEYEGQRVASAEYLQAALLKRANENSDTLMNELRYNQKYWNR